MLRRSFGRLFVRTAWTSVRVFILGTIYPHLLGSGRQGIKSSIVIMIIIYMRDVRKELQMFLVTEGICSVIYVCLYTLQVKEYSEQLHELLTKDLKHKILCFIGQYTNNNKIDRC